MAGNFGFDDGAFGLFVVVEREHLTSGCLSVEQIDKNIAMLQADLHRVGAQMNRALAVCEPTVFTQVA